MIEFDGISLDLPAKITTPAPRKRRYSITVNRKNFYQRHKLACWAVFDLIAFGLFCLALAGNAQILWTLSDPIMRILP